MLLKTDTDWILVVGSVFEYSEYWLILINGRPYCRQCPRYLRCGLLVHTGLTPYSKLLEFPSIPLTKKFSIDFCDVGSSSHKLSLITVGTPPQASNLL